MSLPLRKFLKVGALFLPSFFIGKARAFEKFTDPAFLAKLNGGAFVRAPLFDDVAAVWMLDEVAPGGIDVVRIESIGGLNLDDSFRTVSSATGLRNKCAHFQSENSGYQLTHDDHATLGAGAGVSFTFSFWLKPNTAAGANNPVLAKWDASRFEYVAAFVSGLGFIWQCGNLAGSALPFISATSPSNGTWHHIVVGYDDSLSKIFMQIDNGARALVACVGVRRTIAAFNLGNYSGGSFNDSMAGDLDEVYLWKRALSTGEVTTLFNGGSGRFYAV